MLLSVCKWSTNCTLIVYLNSNLLQRYTRAYQSRVTMVELAPNSAALLSDAIVVQDGLEIPAVTV